MTNPYKCMYVLTEEEYLEYKQCKATAQHIEGAKCPVDGRVYPNENILAHHMKIHVNGFQCNICSKVFKTKRALTAHLKRHPPQVQPSTHSIFDSSTPIVPDTVSPELPKVKKHKHRSVLNFDSSKWLTLK